MTDCTELVKQEESKNKRMVKILRRVLGAIHAEHQDFEPVPSTLDRIMEINNWEGNDKYITGQFANFLTEILEGKREFVDPDSHNGLFD